MIVICRLLMLIHELNIPIFLSLFPTNAAAESVQAGISSLDPCTPSGYSHGVQSGMLPSGALSLKSASLSTLHARGNFSECRSAALMLLQKGKGSNCICYPCLPGMLVQLSSSWFIFLLFAICVTPSTFYHLISHIVFNSSVFRSRR